MISTEEQAWLLEELSRLVQSQGPHPLLSGPIWLPTDAHFPDVWRGDQSSLQALCLRLFEHCGLSGLGVRLEAFDQERAVSSVSTSGEASYRHHGAAAWFAGIDGRTVRFGCAREQLAEAGEGLVGTMAHEVAHAWRSLHGLVRRDREEEECLTDLTTIYLGFGIFTVNNTHRWRTFSEERGAQLYSGWRIAQGGYLSAEAMSFAFALQLRARGTGWWERRGLLRRLEPNQRGYCKAALRNLPASEALCATLDPAPPRVSLSPAPNPGTNR